MKTIKEIKENPKLEILQTGIDGISGILHMIMKAAAKVKNVGFAVTISFNTEQKVTPEYLEKMAKEIEELPPVNFRYFKNVRPIRSENFA